MFYGLISLIVFFLYMTFLFYVARQVEVKHPMYKKFSEHPVVYAMALGVYCTTWTYYGSVGGATVNGMLFLTVYLGPTLAICLWWFLLRKLVRIKHIYRITSIADFISARYDKSQFLAALVTIMALIGIVPYVALQIRASITTFNLIASPGEATFWLEYSMGWLLIAIMILFTIVVGARKLDPSESHKGMLLSIAIQSVVQLIGLLCAGIFITYFLFDGFGDILQRIMNSPLRQSLHIGGAHPGAYLVWATHIILGMSAVMFLPRQFHVAVIENSDEDHIRTAMWVFPLYMFLITIFVVPIAMGGLLKGLSIQYADSFVLRLLLMYGKFWLILIVFLGGISAAVSMIMISSIAIATMVTNHLMFPLIETFGKLGFLKRHLLKCRWVVIAGFILAGYLFEQHLGEAYMLVNIGLISFVAVLQFAPVIIGGLYWRHGNRRGAILGLSAGFLVWFYTLFLPAIIKSGWGPVQLLDFGPWGIRALRPEHLFGISLPDTIVHATFWSMLLNVGLYILGSICSNPDKEEQRIADEFTDVLSLWKKDSLGLVFPMPETVTLAPKKKIIEDLLAQFFKRDESASILDDCLVHAGVNGKDMISVVELAELQKEFERTLTGSIGVSTAHKIIIAARLFSDEESRELSRVYAEVLADFKVPPEELINKISYHREHEQLLNQHALELEEKISELEQQIIERKRSEAALKLAQFSIDNSSISILWVDPKGRIVYANGQALQSLGYTREEMLSMGVWDIDPLMPEERWPEYWANLKQKGVVDIELVQRRKDGSEFPVEIHANYIELDGKEYSFAFIRDITTSKEAKKELEKEKELAEKYLDIVKVMIIGLSPKNEVILVNKKGCEVLGYREEEILGKNWFDHFLPGQFRQEVKAVANKLFEGKIEPVEYYENPILTKNGEERVIAWHNIVLKDEKGGIQGLLSSGEDITDRKKTEKKILQERDFSDAVLNSLPGIFYMFDRAERFLRWNKNFEKVSGYSAEEIKERSPIDFFAGDDKALIREKVQEVFKKGNSDVEAHFITKSGKEILYYFNGQTIEIEGQICLIGMGVDITERRKFEDALRQAVREKETLLNEVHHRVKNNLLTLYSLINLQKISLRGEEDAGKALEDTKQRIWAMGKVHRMLYSSKNFSEIDFSEYIRSLIDEIKITYEAPERHIEIEEDLEPVTLNIDSAIPCGLVINELLVNAFRHAFPDRSSGYIAVSLKRKGEHIELKIKDNGPGIVGDPLSGQGKTLGLRLVTMLSQQLNGKISYDGKQGSLFTIVFKNVTL